MCRIFVVLLLCHVLVAASSGADAYEWLGNESTTEVPAPSTTDIQPTASIPLSLSWEGIITACACAGLLIGLSFDLVSCPVAMFCITLFLRLCGIIDTSESLEGLMNKSVVTVQLLVVLIAPVARLPLAKTAMKYLLAVKRPSRDSPTDSSPSLLSETPSMAMSALRVCLVSYLLSWFVGNMAVTAMLTPLIHQFCIEHDLPSSQLLMPMEIATLIGGMFSKIGVSTTLLVNGMMESKNMSSLPFFELIKVSGLPSLLALLYLTFAPRLLLPRVTAGVVAHVKEKAKSFMGEFVVLGTSPMVGKRVDEIAAEFLSEDMALIQVFAKDGSVHAPPEDSLTIHEHDVVGFTGPWEDLKSYAKLLHLEWQSTETAVKLHGTDRLLEENASLAGTLRAQASPQSVLGQSFARMSIARQRATLRQSMSSPGGKSGAALRVSFSIAEPTEEQSSSSAPPSFAEVVLSPEAVVLGQSPAALRRHYRMALLGLRRKNKNLSPSECLSQRLLLQSGDTLLLLGQKSLFARYHPRDFLVVTMLDGDSNDEDEVDRAKFVAVPQWFPFGRLLLNGTCVAERQRVSNGSMEERELPTDASAVAMKSDSANAPLSPVGEAIPLIGKKSPVMIPGAVAQPNFHTTNKYIKVVAIPKWYPYLSLLIFVAAIVASIAGVELLVACEVALVVSVLLRLRTPEDAYHSLKLEVFIIMAFSFGLGAAMSKSGLSRFIAQKLSSSGLQGWTMLFVVAIAGSGLSNIISSKAAVQVLFPVVVDICAELHEDPMASVSVLATSVIGSFVTPYAHASALLVMGPGGYATKDFYRFGLPLNLCMCILLATAAYLFY